MLNSCSAASCTRRYGVHDPFRYCARRRMLLESTCVTAHAVFEKIREVSTSEKDKGDPVENLCLRYLQVEPTFKNRFAKVYLERTGRVTTVRWTSVLTLVGRGAQW